MKRVGSGQTGAMHRTTTNKLTHEFSQMTQPVRGQSFRLMKSHIFGEDHAGDAPFESNSREVCACW